MPFNVSGVENSQGIFPRDNLQQNKSQVQKEKAEKFKDKLKEASIKFEAFFLNQLLSSMRDTIPRSDLFDDSREREIYEGMLDEALTEEAADAGGIGLADKIYQEHKLEVDNE